MSSGLIFASGLVVGAVICFVVMLRWVSFKDKPQAAADQPSTLCHRERKAGLEADLLEIKVKREMQQLVTREEAELTAQQVYANAHSSQVAHSNG